MCVSIGPRFERWAMCHRCDCGDEYKLFRYSRQYEISDKTIFSDPDPLLPRLAVALARLSDDEVFQIAAECRAISGRR